MKRWIATIVAGAGLLVLASHLPGCTASNPTSTANFTAGMTRANNAILTLAPDGTLRSTAHLVDSGSTNMIVDGNGYFQ